MKKRLLVYVIVLFVLAISLYSTNGMNMIGHGPRSSAMGGLSLGLLDDTYSINTNPAAISFLKQRQIDFSIGLLIPKVKFKNILNNVEAESDIFPLPNFSFVNGGNTDWTFGFGIYSQGGMGATYKDLSHDVFRNYDMDPTTQDDALVSNLEYHSMIGYIKIMPTVSYQINSQTSIGFSPNFGYAMLEMKMPYSIVPDEMKGIANPETGMTFGDMFGAPMVQGGLGYDEVTAYASLDDAVTAYGFGGKLGFSYQANDQLSVGFAYGLKSSLTFEGEASMDMTSQFGQAFELMVGGALQQGAPDVQTAQTMVQDQLAGMGIDMSIGMVAEYDVEIEMSWPQDLGIGFVYKPNEKWLFGADFRWINWKDAMKEFKMTYTNGTNANINKMMGSEDLELVMPLNWEDQVVIILGAEYKVNQKLDLRWGYNYAGNPVPEETLIPIFPAVVENHITLGFGYSFNPSIKIDVGYELNLETELTTDISKIANEYDDSTSSLSENVIHFGLSYKF